MPQERQEDSVFNMALAYLKRIDILLTLCQQSAFIEDIDSWVKHLRGVYREASIRLTPDESTNILGDPNNKINIETLTDFNIQKEEANFRNIYYLMNSPSLKLKNRKIIMFLLDALEVKLRLIMQSRKMLLPNKDDPRMAITQR